MQRGLISECVARYGVHSAVYEHEVVHGITYNYGLNMQYEFISSAVQNEHVQSPAPCTFSFFYMSGNGTTIENRVMT